MDPLELLRVEAAQKRRRAIAKAREEYRRTIREINALGRKIKGRKRYSRGRTGDGSNYAILTTIRAAELVLRDCGPMRLVELTLEVQRRGCRAGDDPASVQRAIRASLGYNRGKFVRDGDQWRVVE